jgi:hypothetical protein
MKNVTMDEIIRLARYFNSFGTSWHFHFLTPKCQFNSEKSFQVILENEETMESFIFKTDNKPVKSLEILEKLFYKKKK